MTERVVNLTHLGFGQTQSGAFVPRVLPGEEIAIADDGTAKVLVPSPDRVTPPCRHFKSCGGCAMQHARDEVVAAWKQDIVARALSAHGLKPRFRSIHTSPPHTRRRAKFAATRTKKGALVGFHARASDTIIAVPNCLLIDLRMRQLLPALESICVEAASRKGEIALTVTLSDAGPDILIETSQPLTAEKRTTLAHLAQSNDLARLSWNDETVVTLAAPSQTFGTAQVVPPPGAFLQATPDGEAALAAAVVEIVGDAARVVDLFAGCGTFSLPLAATAEVHAIEGSAEMIAALDAGWRKTPGLKRVTTEARDLFRRPLETDELTYGAAVIDPPRAGAAAQIATLAASEVPVIAMVSCNPVTFARDAATLVAGGYRLNWVQVVDQFRWSAHVEVVSHFTRA